MPNTGILKAEAYILIPKNFLKKLLSPLRSKTKLIPLSLETDNQGYYALYNIQCFDLGILSHANNGVN